MGPDDTGSRMRAPDRQKGGRRRPTSAIGPGLVIDAAALTWMLPAKLAAGAEDVRACDGISDEAKRYGREPHHGDRNLCPKRPATHRAWAAAGVMRRTILGVLALLAACSRPLSPAETEFAHDLFGPSLDTSQVRVTQGLGIAPLYSTVPVRRATLKATDQACVRKPLPRGAQPPQAFAYRNWLHFDSTLYSSDMAYRWPKALRIPQALILAHELTHAWQWQHRATNGYSATRVIAESLRLADPYYAPPGSRPVFHSYGFEQQAAMVEDFVCFTVANPGNPRRMELHAFLAPVLPIDRFEKVVEGR